MKFSTSSFFHHLNRPEPLTNGLKYFAELFEFRCQKKMTPRRQKFFVSKNFLAKM